MNKVSKEYGDVIGRYVRELEKRNERLVNECHRKSVITDQLYVQMNELIHENKRLRAENAMLMDYMIKEDK